MESDLGLHCLQRPIVPNKICIFFFSKKINIDISCELSADNSHQMSRLIFYEK